ncbi:MAG: hypothetical protein NVSMB29_07350 [Candidatus Dormibacteria bacterium]
MGTVNRQPAPPQPDSLNVSSLRASLMGDGAPTHRQGAPALVPAPVDHGPAPSADAVLAASPNVIRLCETYDHDRVGLAKRGRTQRLGVAALSTAVMVAVAVLFKQERIGSAALVEAVVASAAAAVLALAMLALLWLRDQRRLRRIQGDRMVRALRLRCSLAPGQVEAFIAQASPARRFYECYTTWRGWRGRRGGATV